VALPPGSSATRLAHPACQEAAVRVHEITRELERSMGFDRIEAHARTPEQRRAAERDLTARERRVMERTGREAPRVERLEFADRIRAEARQALRTATTWEQAKERLAERGLAVELYQHPKTGREGWPTAADQIGIPSQTYVPMLY
jgi:hypothetical protein